MTEAILAITPDDLKGYAVPIGVGIAALLFLIAPSMRRALIDSFRKGKGPGERHRREGPRQAPPERGEVRGRPRLHEDFFRRGATRAGAQAAMSTSTARRTVGYSLNTSGS
jgi:hypothetical protein